MRILLVSDTHGENDLMDKIVEKHKNSVDLCIHCGDYTPTDFMTLDDNFDIKVSGNHDEEEYPLSIIENNIYICHGQGYGIYKSYSHLLNVVKENGCSLVFHGHTHIPTCEIIDDILIVNPGSVLINRSTYGFGTYAIVFIEEHISVKYYHSITHEECSDKVLDDGKNILKEFREVLKGS